jgi:hypothetical protein
MSGGAVPCISRVPNYEVREGIMYISADDWAICMPLRIFKLGCAKADRVIARYEATVAEVVPIKGRQRRN